ncbi:ATP-binding cassette domain-containing protein [Streptosporangium lutulentum]|uniref:ABC-2 type transport system ATP-binding protein n=1 Tax=Streptosporangium lutulentum TaxID=1461250 RepID=A0ABT9QM75_9ACTN|nr:ATP-binding cassette domain-containing protein [Streptosporangium lutulentum]MDP9847861.1 ABC-2 type transport system ATP-binding protein [Streptosporangium lutulentum]
MIEVRELTKRYGSTLALDRLSFHVPPGRVTGFLGPNGAGKSTTLRVIVGLHGPTSGVALVNGRRYAEISRPLYEVGALLDAGAVHPGRTAFKQLACLARSHRIGSSRIMTLLDQVGLRDVAHKRIGGFSLGMRQRLGIAAALLGDPGVVLLDEPVNGLDAEGIRWVRGLMRTLASEGRTVLLSSHLMSEMALTIDHVLIIGRGRLIAESSMEDLAKRFRRDILVRSPKHLELGGILRAAGMSVSFGPRDGLVVTGADTATIGDLAAERRVPIHELTQRSATLEDVYLELTDEAADHRAGAGKSL